MRIEIPEATFSHVYGSFFSRERTVLLAPVRLGQFVEWLVNMLIPGKWELPRLVFLQQIYNSIFGIPFIFRMRLQRKTREKM